MRVCPACDCHVFAQEPRCPHCEAPMPGAPGADRQALRVGATLGLGLTLTACIGGVEAVYGVPDTGFETDPTSAEDTQGEVCEPPENAGSSGETAVISIRNDRAEAVYVLPYSSFACNYGKVEIEIGGEPVLWDHQGTYAYDCSADLCDWGCSDGGDMGFIINPGAEAQVQWGGGFWTDAVLSEACKDEMSCVNDPGDTCSVRTLVEGDYTVRVNLSATCPVADECMACTDGVCEVFFYEPGLGEVSESFEVSATFPAGAQIIID